MTSERMGRACAAALMIVALGTACGGQPRTDESASEVVDPTPRQSEVAEAGAMVMPFDLERTTHVFEKTDFGGVQTVVSDDRDDEQIRLVREHLSMEAERFSEGDFHDPAMIHGDDMAGLHALVMGADRLGITYVDVESGGRIRYESEDPSLVEALHLWFDAQLADHGTHAQGHH